MPALPSPCPGAAVALRRRRRSPAWREVRVTCRDVRVPAGKSRLAQGASDSVTAGDGTAAAGGPWAAARPRDRGGGGPPARAATAPRPLRGATVPRQRRRGARARRVPKRGDILSVRILWLCDGQPLCSKASLLVLTGERLRGKDEPPVRTKTKRLRLDESVATLWPSAPLFGVEVSLFGVELQTKRLNSKERDGRSGAPSRLPGSAHGPSAEHSKKQKTDGGGRPRSTTAPEGTARTMSRPCRRVMI